MSFGFGFGFTKITAAIRAAFSPSSLFAANEPGVWLDPSDFSTMFQDAAGTVPVTAVEQPVGRILDKSGRGFHATQTTATSRPVLSARVNLLTKTEQFDDAVWVKNSATVVANASAAPDGTMTADFLAESSATSIHYVMYNVNSTYPTATEISIYAKASLGSSTNFLQIILPYNSLGGLTDASRIACFDLVNGAVSFSSSEMLASIADVGAGWWRCKVTKTPVQPTYVGKPIVALSKVDATTLQDYTGDGASGIYIWGASLVPANQAHLPYQRVNTATDYDTVGFPHYLRFDGVDDWMVTNTITPGTDKVQVFAGVRKLSGAVQVFLEFSQNSADNNGTFGVFTPSSTPTNNIIFDSKGTVKAAAGFNGLIPPITNLVSCLGDISGDSAILRIDGTQAASNTANQGTGNFLAYPLYIGRRGGTTFPFNGHLYSLIVRFGSNLPIETIEKTEKHVNTKTRAY